MPVPAIEELHDTLWKIAIANGALLCGAVVWAIGQVWQSGRRSGEFQEIKTDILEIKSNVKDIMRRLMR
jgi:hypothetical protein